MAIKRILAVVAGLGLLGIVMLGVLAAVGPASAAPSFQTGPTGSAPAAQTGTTGAVAWTAGKITALQTNGFTLQGANQQLTTVTVGANTWIVVKTANQPAQGALADLKVGDMVSVGGLTSGTNQIAARVVQVGGAGRFFGPAGERGPQGGFRGRPGAGGPFGMPATIQSVANGTLTVTLGKGTTTRTLTVQTDAGTLVVKNGLATVADLKAGDAVEITPRFHGRAPGPPAPASPPALTAAVIYVPGANDTLIHGRVQAVSGNTLTLGAAGRGTSVNVDANTTVKMLSATGTAPAAAHLSDVQVGTSVLIYESKPAQGQTGTASLVLIQPVPQKPQQPVAPTDGGL